MDTAMNPIQRIRTVLDAYKTPGSAEQGGLPC